MKMEKLEGGTLLLLIDYDTNLKSKEKATKLHEIVVFA